MSGSSQAQAGDFTPPGGSNGITGFINNSSNVGKEASQTIVSEALGHVPLPGGLSRRCSA